MNKKSYLIAFLVVGVLIALDQWGRRDSGSQQEPEVPFYTFKTCERHLDVLLYLFGEDPADWPDHEHYPMPGDDDYHPMHATLWGQSERDLLVYGHSPGQELGWSECTQFEGWQHHVHSSNPELTRRQHTETEMDLDPVGLIGPDVGELKPLTAEQKTLLRLQLDLLEERIHILKEMLELLDEEPIAVPQEEPALFPWLEERTLEA